MKNVKRKVFARTKQNQIIEVLPAKKISIFKSISKEFGTPLYIYFEDELIKKVEMFKAIPAPFGLTVRYAIKANSTAAILNLFNKNGVHFDASTYNESFRLIKGAGIDGKKIRLTSQEVLSKDRLKFIAKNGILYTACSLLQLETYGKTSPNTEVGIRFNIGIGSGHFPHVSTGGKNSSFGIYKQRKEIASILKKCNLTLKVVHLHIGSGSDPVKQKSAIIEGLKVVNDYPSVSTLNMGGGFKVAIVRDEKATDIKDMGKKMRDALKKFEKETGRKIKLEIEPGKALVANAGYILTEIVDKVTTGSGAKEFLKVNGGMNMNVRIPMHGAPHPFIVIPKGTSRGIKEYVVSGICCENGDVLTIRPWDSTIIEARKMLSANVGELFVIGGTGGYCSSMASLNYNSQQIHPEILVRKNGTLDLIRTRQPIEDIWKYERIPPDLK